MKKFLLYLYAESPIHAGAPDADGAVDLPIQREKSTGYPVIWGQSLKGALRQTARGRLTESDVTMLFGAGPGEDNGDTATAGTVTVGDAQLVAMPIATLHNAFAWVTSPISLGRMARKYVHSATATDPVPHVEVDGGRCTSDTWKAGKQVLGPFLVNVTKDDNLKKWATRLADDGIGDGPHMEHFVNRFKENLILVGDNIMQQLVREGTEIAVRVQLHDHQRTVKHGPFTSEYLPTESLLVSLLTLRDDEHAADLKEMLDKKMLQIGGDQTLGKGLVWSRLVEVGQ